MLGVGGSLANFTPGHQETCVDFENDDRAPLLFIAGGEDHIMPPAVNRGQRQAVPQLQGGHRVQGVPRAAPTTRSGQDGWEEVADYALDWAVTNGASNHTSGRL